MTLEFCPSVLREGELPVAPFHFHKYYLEDTGIQRADVLPRSRSLDMAVTGDSGKKKRGGKVFGSLERGLDKMINMLTPSKRRGLRDGPRKIRVHKIAPSPLFCTTCFKQIWVGFGVFFAATVQCYSDQSDQPGPGAEPDPLHPTREKRRFHTEGVERFSSYRTFCPCNPVSIISFVLR